MNGRKIMKKRQTLWLKLERGKACKRSRNSMRRRRRRRRMLSGR